jgi:hypothetical protein
MGRTRQSFASIAAMAQHSLLRSQNVVLVYPAPLKEAVVHHVLAKQKNNGYQDNYKEELYNS